MIDSNEDNRNGDLDRELRRIGLISGIRNRHGNNAPPTQQQGSTPIDDMYVTQNAMIDKAGFLPFGEGPGDHRGLFIDVNLQNLVGGDFHKIHGQQARRLISHNVKVSEKFNTLFQEQLNRNHVDERISALTAISPHAFNDKHVKEYEKLDRLQVDAFRYANKRCRRLRFGEVPYAPEAAQLEGRKANLFTLIIRRKLGCHVSSKTIRKFSQKCGVDDPFSLGIDEAKRLRALAWKEYKRLKPNSRSIRDKWMEQKVDDSNAEGDEQKAELLQKMRRREELRDAHSKIKRARKKFHSAGTQQLTIPADDGQSIIHINDKEEMESLLMKFNKEKYQGANDTPFMKSPLVGLVGMLAETKYADDILKGEAILPSELDQGTLDFLRALKLPDSIMCEGAINPDIDIMEHTRFWGRARVSTQSSMSGLHFGFYKSTAKSPSLAQTVLNFIRIPFNTGFSLSRFQQSLNVHLMKEEGNCNFDRQRTIHLLEANFAEGCRFIFSKRMIWNAKDKGLMPETQYARKGGKAIDGALQKVLTLDHFRMTRTPGIGFANDLLNCYDRVVHSSAALAMLRLGVNTTAITCLFSTLQNMKNYIRTAYGDSDGYYSGDPGRPLQGGGQGNPAAAPMWTAISMVIMAVLSLYEPGVKIWSAVSLTLISFSVILFVDDTDIFVSGTTAHESIQSVSHRAQQLINKWTAALWASGGCLRPKKCWFYAVNFEWAGSDWKYQDIQDMDIHIEVPDHSGELKPERQINYNEPAVTLGVALRVDGDNSGVVSLLEDETRDWADQMKSAFLYRFEAILSIMTTISRTWSYPLQVTTMAWEECESIMVIAYDVILSKMGINKKISRIFRFAPTSIGGLGLPHLYIMQGIAHILAILNHCNRDTQIGHMLVAQLELACIEVGTGQHLFELPFQPYSALLTHCWIRST